MAAIRMISLPGSVQFSARVREHRTTSYRTWHSPHPDMKHLWECLLCGEWGSGYETRAEAEHMGAVNHPRWCHVRTGCSCREPHITAQMAARLGIRDEYPAHLAALLFKLAGGVRKPCRPCFDRHGYPHCDTARQMITDLAAELADSPRYQGDTGAYFEEVAAQYGRDFAGLAWMQAALKTDQAA